MGRLFRRMLASCLLCVAGTAPLATAEPIVLADPIPKEATYASRVMRLVCADALSQLGYELELRMYPPLRASVESAAGRIDGEAGRARGYAETQPGLVRVEESVMAVKVAAFAHKPGLKVDGWDSLKSKPYRVEYRSGYVTFKAHLEQVLPANQISSAIDGRAGLMRLVLGHSDLYIDAEELGLTEISRQRGRYGKVYHAGLVETTPVFVYLHSRHAALAPRLAAVLAKMKADGTIDRYIAQALKEEER